MLKVIFVETALETVPKSILRHPSVRRNARRRGKAPEETLLDRSVHHHAMKGLPNAGKRGRPDIIHFCLLEALGSPLNRAGGLRVWAHTVGGYALEVSPETRLPRDCNRFNGLMEQLLKEGRVPPGPGEPLLRVREMSLGELKEAVEPSRTVALTSHGRQSSLEALCGELSEEESPLAFIGAYPSGPMEDETLAEADDAVSIHPEALEAWTVTSRLIYEYEKALRLA